VPPFSPESVAAAVTTLYADPSLRRQLAKAAKQHVEKHFMLEQTLDAMQNVFAEVLQRKAVTQ
jgi:glycosyltransferase involved in cell wall biosynthesis